MTRLNLTRTMMIATASGGHRAFAVASTRPLQKRREEGRSKEDETLDKAIEAAESLKDGANQVKETCAIVREAAETTSNTVTKVADVVTHKVTQATDAVKDKLKEPMDGILSDATKQFEDRMVDKIKDRVLSKDAADKANKD